MNSMVINYGCDVDASGRPQAEGNAVVVPVLKGREIPSTSILEGHAFVEGYSCSRPTGWAPNAGAPTIGTPHRASSS